MIDRSQNTKAVLLAKLDSALAVTALVPPSRIFPMKVEEKPSFPFIRYGSPTVNPFQDNCGEGSDEDIRIHVFATGEGSCQQIAAAVVAALNNMPEFYLCDWVSTQYIMDDQGADTWHAIINFRVINKT